MESAAGLQLAGNGDVKLRLLFGFTGFIKIKAYIGAHIKIYILFIDRTVYNLYNKLCFLFA